MKIGRDGVYGGFAVSIPLNRRQLPKGLHPYFSQYTYFTEAPATYIRIIGKIEGYVEIELSILGGKFR